MKNILLAFLLLIGVAAANAQVPEGVNYQSVLRNSTGLPVANTVVKLRFTIQNLVTGGTVMYKEEQLLTTTSLGLITAVIGRGTILSGRFDSINWAAGSAYLKIETDIGNTGTYIEAGTSEMVSVPYALSAKRGGLSYQSFNSGLFTTTLRDSIVTTTDSLVVAESGTYLIAINANGQGLEYNFVTNTNGDNEIDGFLMSGNFSIAFITLSNYLKDDGSTPAYNLTGRASSISVTRHLNAGDVLRPGVRVSKFGSVPTGIALGFSSWEMNLIKIQ